MAATARVTLQAVDEAFTMTETKFDVHEHVVIKRKKEASLTFQEIQRIIKGDILQINQREPLLTHFQDSKSSISLMEGSQKLTSKN